MKKATKKAEFKKGVTPNSKRARKSRDLRRSLIDKLARALHKHVKDCREHDVYDDFAAVLAKHLPDVPPLKWRNEGVCLAADTPFGCYLAYTKSWSLGLIRMGEANSIDEAKRKAHEHYRNNAWSVFLAPKT